jgi:hypothetical protein
MTEPNLCVTAVNKTTGKGVFARRSLVTEGPGLAATRGFSATAMMVMATVTSANSLDEAIESLKLLKECFSWQRVPREEGVA